MAIRVALSHRTTYRYARLAALSPQVVRLRPSPHNRTPIHEYSLKIEPGNHFINWLQDPFGNFVARIVVPERTELFQVSVDLVADLVQYDPFDFFLEPSAEEFPFRYGETVAEELRPYLQRLPVGTALGRLLATIDRTPRRTVDFLVDVNRCVHHAVEYVIRMEPGVQDPDHTLASGRGSCRDSAWLLVQVLRNLGLAARFASGYLIQLKPDQKPIEGPPGPTVDFTDLHAWCECYVPGAGWIGLDPTSGLLATEGHIPLACSPNPSSAAPVEGGVEKVDTEFDFAMSVTRIVDRPRVTRPYSDEQWRDIVSCGHQVDERLSAGDVRLTMGGEPTFVGTVHPDAPEWNIEALGREKHGIADRLIRKLTQQWQPHSLLHHGQGKWYPGEQLPRWSLTAYYRKDGEPLWHDETLSAPTGHDFGHGVDDAERFTRALVAQLGLASSGLMPAFEDAWYYLWKERRLPTNVDPHDARLEDPLERERLARVFRQGLQATVGWVLPLGHDGLVWRSGPWLLRDEHCYLYPGDSPMGLRLPLDSLPWLAPQDARGLDAPLDPTAPRAPLPPHQRLAAAPTARQVAAAPEVRRQYPKGTSEARVGRTLAEPTVAPERFESASGLVRTALCVQPRGGCLRVFMPPLTRLEAYVELVGAVESCASKLGLPIQVEGYPPPHDPRLGSFKVTPDPGVIEVNVPPVSNWTELLEQTESVYETARSEKLVAEKFDVDGRHVGSGGGNHMVLGGDTTLDSPFLRRPDLLRSLLTLWNNYPSLSYLFSGQFIGPTSQAPRVDEARHESVHELELAFKQLPARGVEAPPWLIDRVLRHLLTDTTGNTHRAEFCIDKLYSPDSATGRLGLLELRAFEMPPHARMASAQQLLLRALIAHCWNEPYTRPLVRWGTSLHDRFLLPHFVEQDFSGVIALLQSGGCPIQLEWFRPHFEFRFPLLGEYVRDAVLVELRGALEPWHVLGEEAAGGGQARYVDSSLERLQVHVKGLIDGRHAIACNGVALPLHPTGSRGEAVCGVRYRAWQPPSCLHPTIGIDSPLRFDVYDTWSGRAIGGCTYHVVHPGGRSAEDRPINAEAAEGRRAARFERAGHRHGEYEVMKEAINPEFPLTLDLRRSH